LHLIILVDNYPTAVEFGSLAMAFQFTCPYCFKKTLVEDKYEGQTGPCACCGKAVTLPTLNKSSQHATSKHSASSLYVSSQVAPSILKQDVCDGSPATTSVADSATSDSTIENTAQDIFADRFPSETSLRNASVGNQHAGSSNIPPVVVSRVIEDPGASARRQQHRKYWFLGLGTLGVVIFGFVAYGVIVFLLSTPAFQNLQDQRNRSMSMNYLKRIALALNTYAATHGTYPPAIVYDDKGVPKHSWRVLILRELGEHSLYNQYNFDQPWDSEANLALVSKCPSQYVCPSSSGSWESSYFLVVGGNTIFPDGSPLGPEDISDGLRNTILVVEAQNTTHEWTKPIDYVAGGNSAIKLGGNHKGGFTAVSADGTPLWIPDNTSSTLVDSMITPKGNEQVDVAPFAR
jgi:Protein of unknown function (DUF1559)